VVLYLILATLLLQPLGCSLRPQSTSNTSYDFVWLNPSDLIASGISTSNKVNISWRWTAGNNRFSVYRSDFQGENSKLLGETSDSTFVDFDAMPGQKYRYMVAVDSPQTLKSEVSLSDAPYTTGALSTCLSRASVLHFKSFSTLAQLAPALQEKFNECKSELSGFFDAPLSEDELMMVFSSIVSHGSASYGGSNATELFEGLHEDYLDCDNYAWLAGNLYEALRGSGYSESKRLMNHSFGLELRRLC
jgi:hypothetical protein